MRDDFCAFILTHGRPDKVLTYRTLRRAGYTGKIFIVVDDEDKTRHQYMAEFGEQVLVFSKADIASRFDEADNFCDRRSIFYARNACFDLAKLVGCKYFIQLDDDYHEFQFRVDRNYDQAYFPIAKNAKADAAAKDQTVTAPVAPEGKTEDIVPGPSAPNTGDQNIGTVDVKITKSKMAPVKWNGEEQLALGPSGTYNTILADQFKQAFRALANEVEADLGALYFGASRAVGTAGTTPFGVKDDLSDAALARQVLEDNGAPTTDLQMVLGSTAIANLRGKQSVLFKVNESGTEQLLREGVLGRLEGFNIHSSAGVKRAPKVAATGYLVNGEKKEGDVLISIDTGSGSISAGQIVTFAGDPNQYVVAAATSNLITLAAPGLRQDLADDTAITVVGAFTANMAFDRNAFLLASRTPAMPEGGDNADDVMNVTDPISGITFQIALYRQYRQVRYEVGLAWGVSSVKPAHGCLILG